MSSFALGGAFEVRQTPQGEVIVPKSEPWPIAEEAAKAAAAAAAAAKAAEEAAMAEAVAAAAAAMQGTGAGAGAGAGAGVAAPAAAHQGREKDRLVESSAGRIESSGKIGGAFEASKMPAWLKEREASFDELVEQQRLALEAKEKVPITVTLPDGTEKEGIAWQTTPMDIAKAIAKSLAKKCIVAAVLYTERLSEEVKFADCDEDEDGEDELADVTGELWDMTRPLEGSCKIWLKTYDDKEGQLVFKHSSAHVLGAAIEAEYGGKLCIGPPTKDGFYYDAFLGGSRTFADADYKSIEGAANKLIKQRANFQRVALSKQQALHLFRHNPFKVQLISNKVPDGGYTTAYRCGHLIDLCMGPHLPDTGKVTTFSITKHSAAYWLGSTENDSLQRVYGVAFPDKKKMAQYKKWMKEAKDRDHRKIGNDQDLFFFHDLSPGSCFWMPRGAHMYNKLMDFIRNEYHARGYSEVVTPNLFNIDLWKVSGHYDHYYDDMFHFKVDNTTEFGLKPMNCPGHCLMFDHRVRSHRELPMRLADFGVLHRNEASGALSGLTRVRRFQQDDAHIFCRQDQIGEEVAGVLDMMAKVYGIFGFEFKLFLSTRPAKALGEVAVWDEAEKMMTEALDNFGHPWSLNPGDGAFYGPKIDIQVFDALGRAHQCATVQLDFQLPIRFKLQYRDNETNLTRPVIIHRAILGSVERMMAVLCEHTAGKWPFWISPRQVLVVPVAGAFNEYGQKVRDAVHNAGFLADVDTSGKTLNKKVREGQVQQYNYIVVVGAQEQEAESVMVRNRDVKEQEPMPLEAFIKKLKDLDAAFQ